MKISHRLLWSSVLTTLVSVLVAMSLALYMLHGALLAAAHDKLDAVVDARAQDVHTFLDDLHKNVLTLSRSSVLQHHLSRLSDTYATLPETSLPLLRQSLQQIAVIDTADQASSYVSLYRQAESDLLQQKQLYQWHDLFLIDRKGNVVYSSDREQDLASNLLTGPWQEGGLARVIKPLMNHPVDNTISFTEFAPYAPSQHARVSFVATPVFNHQQELLGFVAIQLPVSQLADLLASRHGLGETGKSQMIDSQAWLLSEDEINGKKQEAKQLNSDAVRKVLSGKEGSEVLTASDGVTVLEAFKPIVPFAEQAMFGDKVTWGVLVRIDESEILHDFYRLRNAIILVTFLLLALAIFIATLGARNITRPILALKDTLARLAQREQVDVPHLDRRDEIGQMAQAAEVFRKMALQVEQDHWVSQNLATLTSVVSTQSAVNEAANQLLHHLCPLLNVPVGAIYLRQGNDFVRIGLHGLARRNQQQDRFAQGEGMVGQCAQDNAVQILSPVPQGLVIISTGLAEFPPQELVLYPISWQKEVLAVVELACLSVLTARQHVLLQAIREHLGLYLTNLLTAEHNKTLLFETQQQSAELQAQSENLQNKNVELQSIGEELRAQSEEMRTQNEELKANQEELRAQQDEMSQKNQLLEEQKLKLNSSIEETKHKAEELLRANQYKSEFLANMSHELRTPLNSLLILARDLMDNEAGNLTSEQVESASVISESGQQLLTLINDILDLSKIEAGKLEIHQESFALQDMLSYLTRIFEPQASKKQLQLNFSIDSEVPPQVVCDRQRLTQVLTNLLSNAIKFTEHGQVALRIKKHLSRLCCEVCDTGVGIPSDKLEHVFGAFQQLDGSISRKFGGSGLGLAISRQLAQLLGGEILATSQVGKGSCFSLYLPLHAGTTPIVEAKAPSLSSSAAQQLPHFLVVEDDPQLANVLSRMISVFGYRVSHAASAELAQEQVMSQTFSGVLLDIGLPQMDGIHWLTWLRGQKTELARLPVFAMSGSVDDGRAVAAGALGFLEKPVTRDMVHRAIDRMLQQPMFDKVVLTLGVSETELSQLQITFSDQHLLFEPYQAGQMALSALKNQQYAAIIFAPTLVDMAWQDCLAQLQNLALLPPLIAYVPDTLSEADVFTLKEVSESVVVQSKQPQRLYEELARAIELERRQQSDIQPKLGKRLLVVDDDTRNLFALTKVLRHKGYLVDSVPDSQGALEKVQSQSYDAVLTDIMMPVVDGYTLIRNIRALGFTQLPIIAITAKSMIGDEELCLQAGANAYLAKPVEMTRLLLLLQEL